MKVDLIEYLGNDNSPVRRARASYEGDKREYTEEQNQKLLDRLMNDKHYGVLEGNVVTIMIETTIPIARQIMRHRTFSYNERSRRYLDGNHTPFTFDYPKVRGDKDTEIKLSQEEFNKILDKFYKEAVKNYELLREKGVAKEIARYILPQGMETRFYMTGNLRNWLHFLSLRLDSHAQKEVRDIAIEINKILNKIYPNIMKSFNKFK